MSSGPELYFITQASAGFYGSALWVTDGTAAGTRLIEGFQPGTVAGAIGEYDNVFFFATTGPGSTQIYGTLGEPGSTQVINAFYAPIGPLPLTQADLGSLFTFLSPTQIVGGLSYGGGAYAIYFDGTAGGTQLLAYIPAQSYLSPEYITDFTNVGGTIFFLDGNADGVCNIYRSDGTTADTTKITSAKTISNLTAATSASTGSRLIFSQVVAGGVTQLAALTTTATTPTVITSFAAGTVVNSITSANGELFIATTDASGDGAILASDGSNAAPVQVGSFVGATPTQVTVAGDGSQTVYFQAGDTLWVATPTGSTALGTFAALGEMYALGGELYFAADDGVHGMELWKTNGSAAGTMLVADIDPGAAGSNPTSFSSLNGLLYFSANNGTGGTQLWSSNGTSAGTTMVADLQPGATDGSILPGVVGTAPSTVGTPLVSFTGGVSDGTAAGTYHTYGAPPGEAIFSLLSGANSVVLQITHGTSGNTITVPVSSSVATSFGQPAYAQGGAFFSYVTVDAQTRASSYLGYIGDNSLAPVALATFAPTSTTSFSAASILNITILGSQAYVLVAQQDGNGNTLDTQLWTSDGTVGNTSILADLGASGLSDNIFNQAVIADANGWAALLDNGAGTVVLATVSSSGVVAFATPADLGLTGDTIDNTQAGGLARVGAKLVFSVATANGTEAVVSDGTAAGTAVLASATSAFGDFTNSGTLVYFDDGIGGGLWVTDGTAAGTHQLLSGGAYIAPYTSAYVTRNVASTATIVSGGTTWFYFAATENGVSGLYRTDGTTVQTVLASGVGTNPYVVASGGEIFFAGNLGSGNTLLVSDPATNTVAPVTDPALFPPGSIAAQQFGPVTNPTDLAPIVTDLPNSDVAFLTTGIDTVAGGPGDTTIYGTTGDLNVGDVIDGGGGINDLQLSGTGTFDLSLPTTFANIQLVDVNTGGATVILRQGTSLTVNLLEPGNIGNTVIGAENNDTISGQSGDTVTLGGSGETVSGVGRVIMDAAASGATVSYVNTLELTSGGTYTLGNNITGIGFIKLDAPTLLNVDFSLTNYDTEILGGSGGDTITLSGPVVYTNTYFIISGGGGGDKFIIAPPTGSVAPSVEFKDTGADLNGSTITGFNFDPANGSPDTIDITDFGYSAAEKVTFANGVLKIDRDGTGSDVVSIAIAGTPPANGGFVASGDGSSGSLITFIPQLFTLTTGVDTVVGTGQNIIYAASNTLSSGDQINGGATNAYGAPTSTLELVGAGTFDLSQPALLTGLSSIIGDTSGENGGNAVNQTIILRNGFNQGVTLGPGHDTVIGAMNAATITSVQENVGTVAGDTITLGDVRESVSLQGSPLDVIHVDAATAGASVSDMEFQYFASGTLAVDGGGVVGVGNADLATVTLTSPTSAFFIGDSPNTITGSTGTDFIDATFPAASYSAGTITVQPNGGGDTVVAPKVDSMILQGSAAALNGTTIEAFNFLPGSTPGFGYPTPDKIDITDMSPSGTVVPTFNNGTLTVTEGALRATFYLPGAPSSGTFTVGPDSTGTGTLLNFVPATTVATISGTLTGSGFIGSPGDDTLTVTPSGFTAGQVIDGAGGSNEIVLSGTGTFDLSAPATLTDFQLLSAGTADVVTLRSGLTMEILADHATVVGADSPDPIVLVGYGSDNTIDVRNAGAKVIDGTTGNTTTIAVDTATIGASIVGNRSETDALSVTGSGTATIGANIININSFYLDGSGLDLQASNAPGQTLTIDKTGDTARAGAGGDTLVDTTTGGNTLVGGAGNDLFVLGDPISSPIQSPTNDVIDGFDQGGTDTIVFGGDLFYGQPVFSNGTLTVTDPSDPSKTQSVVLEGNYSGTFSGVSKANYNYNLPYSGFYVTFTGTETPCYCAGTLIAVADGEKPVEALQIGELVRTAAGQLRPIKWIGTRSYSARLAARNPDVLPVRIARNALGDGVPHRDLLVSPLHAMYLHDVLVPARLLVNGESITDAAPMDPIRYFHIELESHDILLANGAAAESFVDCDNRGMFQNAAEFAELYPRDNAVRWGFCAPRVEDGELLEVIRANLARRAELFVTPPSAQCGRLFGFVDMVSRRVVRGWAWHPDHPEEPVHLEIVVDDEVVGKTVANRDRPDVRAAGYGHGRYGFQFYWPQPLGRFAEHVVQVRRSADGAALADARTLPAVTELDAKEQQAISHAIEARAAEARSPHDLDDLLRFLLAEADRLREARLLPLVDAGPLVLIVDDELPAPERDAGSCAVLDHVSALLRLGYSVAFAPRDMRGDARGRRRLDGMGVLSLTAPAYGSVEEVLRCHGNAISVVYLHRIANAASYAEMVRLLCPRARLIYSVADLHFVRIARQAAVEQRPTLEAQSRILQARELRAVRIADAVITHSAVEAAILRQADARVNVHVVPWSVRPRPTASPFPSRAGVAFVGGYDHVPNVDAALFLVQVIMPRVWRRNPDITCVLAGSNMPERVRQLAGDRVDVIGAVDDLMAIFDRVRVSVAPLRFGAGLKGKVLESLAAGIPCICTQTAAEGIALEGALSQLIAKGVDELAARIVQLHDDEARNAACAAAGVALLKADFTAARVDHLMLAALGATSTAPARARAGTKHLGDRPYPEAVAPAAMSDQVEPPGRVACARNAG